MTKLSLYSLKRVLDCGAGLALLILTAPFFLLVYLALILVQKGSPIRWVDASGRGGIPFSRPVLRFETEYARRLLKRLTFSIRDFESSLINHPSLFLVLKGKMSLIGPSPHHFRKHLFLADKMEGYERRLRASPGLISPAILAPKPCSAKLALQIEILYCEKASLSFDLWLLGRYVSRAFQR